MYFNNNIAYNYARIAKQKDKKTNDELDKKVETLFRVGFTREDIISHICFNQIKAKTIVKTK